MKLSFHFLPPFISYSQQNWPRNAAPQISVSVQQQTKIAGHAGVFDVSKLFSKLSPESFFFFLFFFYFYEAK